MEKGKKKPRRFKFRRMRRIRSKSQNDANCITDVKLNELNDEISSLKFIQNESEKKLMTEIKEDADKYSHSLGYIEPQNLEDGGSHPPESPGPHFKFEKLPSLKKKFTDDTPQMQIFEESNFLKKATLFEKEDFRSGSDEGSVEEKKLEYTEQSSSEYVSYRNVFSLTSQYKTNTKSIAKFEDRFYREERCTETRIIDKIFSEEEEKKRNRNKLDPGKIDLMTNLAPAWGKKDPIGILKAHKNLKCEGEKIVHEHHHERVVRFNKQVLVKEITGRVEMKFRYENP